MDFLDFLWISGFARIGVSLSAISESFPVRFRVAWRGGLMVKRCPSEPPVRGSNPVGSLRRGCATSWVLFAMERPTPAEVIERLVGDSKMCSGKILPGAVA